jgi:hypothetical protein
MPLGVRVVGLLRMLLLMGAMEAQGALAVEVEVEGREELPGAVVLGVMAVRD